VTTLEQYIKPAEKYGVELVYETAKQEWVGGFDGWRRQRRDQLPRAVDLTWMAPADRDRLLEDRERAFREYRAEFDRQKQEVAERLFRLRVELDRIAFRTGPTVGQRRRRSGDETTRAVQMLAGEGLITSEIALKLGISAAHVQRVLKGSRPPVSTPSFAGGLPVRTGKPRERVAVAA
jgi:hypothetical protein